MRVFFCCLLLVSPLILSSCDGSAPENSQKNAQAVNVTATKSVANSSPANDSFATTKTPEAATVNSGQMLAAVVEGYYSALRKKDEAGVKKFLSNEAITYWNAEAKSEKQPILSLISDMESPLEEKREVRNEKIEGASAIAEIKGGGYGVWTKVKFVKENGEWKFASPLDSPELLAK